MTIFIRFYCVSLLFIGITEADIFHFVESKKVVYDSFSAIKSTTQSPTENIQSSLSETLQGQLFFEEEAAEKIFPVKMGFVLDDANAVIDSNLGEIKSYSINEPGDFLGFAALKAFKGKKIPFIIVEKPPYLTYPESFLNRYGSIKLFSTPLFASYFGEDLHNLMTIVYMAHAYDLDKVGDGFEIIEDKTDLKPYMKKKVFMLKEVHVDYVVVEIASYIERQKIYGQCPQQVVLSSQTSSIWTIDRQNSLKFKVDEKGHFLLSMRIDGNDILTTHAIERHSKTSD